MGDQDILQEGINFYKRQDYNAALAFFISLPQDCGADALEIEYYLGLCYFKLNRYEDALIYLEQVVTALGGKAAGIDEARVLQCRYILAVIYSQADKQDLADFELNALMTKGYNPSAVSSSMAYVAWKKGEVERCIECYEGVLASDENNVTALNGLGYVLASENRDLKRALELCKKALNLAPDSAACLDSLGWVYYRLGLFSQARKYLERAKEIDGSNKVILQHLEEAELVNE